MVHVWVFVQNQPRELSARLARECVLLPFPEPGPAGPGDRHAPQGWRNTPRLVRTPETFRVFHDVPADPGITL